MILPGPDDWSAIRLTLLLAGVVTALLVPACIPLAWWLARGRSRTRSVVGALTSLPLVLPPTVLGFYLLVAMGPHGPLGALTHALGLGTLAFRFPGLVLASMVYSLPFVVQPLRTAFASVAAAHLELAAVLRAPPLDAFLHVALPLARPGLLAAAVLGFAHTVGEFGVVLMIGGNIPGETRVVSMQLFDHVESLDYARAHWLAAGLLAFSFVVLYLAHRFDARAAAA